MDTDDDMGFGPDADSYSSEDPWMADRLGPQMGDHPEDRREEDDLTP